MPVTSNPRHVDLKNFALHFPFMVIQGMAVFISPSQRQSHGRRQDFFVGLGDLLDLEPPPGLVTAVEGDIPDVPNLKLHKNKDSKAREAATNRENVTPFHGPAAPDHAAGPYDHIWKAHPEGNQLNYPRVFGVVSSARNKGNVILYRRPAPPSDLPARLYGYIGEAANEKEDIAMELIPDATQHEPQGSGSSLNNQSTLPK
jgi:hypothetical protein